MRLHTVSDWAFRVVVAVLLTWLVFRAAGCGPMDVPNAGHIYDTSFGSVYCSAVGRSPCGVDLSNCADGHSYFCMQNVRERE